MQLLGQVPQVVTHLRYPFETFVANHICKLFKYGAPPKVIGPFPDYRFHGANPPFDDALEHTMATTGRLSFKQIIVDIYTQLAAAYGKPNVTHFAEKFGLHLLPVLQEMFNRPCIVVLIRDFRDVLSSYKEFNEKRGYPAFGMEQFDSMESFLHGQFIGRVRSFVAGVEHWKQKVLVVKYEDFVAGNRNILFSILKAAGIVVSDEALTTMFNQGDGDLGHHATSASGIASVSKYKTVLTAREIAICNSALARELEVFGYT